MKSFLYSLFIPLQFQGKLQHPLLLYVLCLVQFFERFGFYILRILLVLYCSEALASGGMGWSTQQALAFNGLYFGFVHVQPLLGGWLSDRFFGPKISVVLGQIALLTGYLLLSTGQSLHFYLGLFFIAIGYGLFKPSLATLVGALFPTSDTSRDHGFSLLYISVTIGIFFAAFAGGYLQKSYQWHKLFLIAASFVFVGQLLFLLSYRWQGKKLQQELRRNMELPAQKNIPLNKEEWKQTKFLLILSVFAVLFFAAHNEGGSLLMVYLYKYVDRSILEYEIPAPWFTGIGAMLTTLLTLALGWLWRRLQTLGYEITSTAKIAFGLSCTALAFFLLSCASWKMDATTPKTSLFWIFSFQGLFVLSKACVNPLLWSMTAKYAPKRYRALYMGILLCCASLGHLLGGGLNAFITTLDYFGLFLITATMMTIAAIVLISLQSYFHKILQL